ncbi:MAG: L,D-transpeptidase family protein [Pseudomonadota bacterium]
MLQLKSRILACCFISLSSMAALAQTLPAHIFSRGVEQAKVLLVDKAARQAHLVEIQGDQPVSVRTYTDLLFGENDGPKVVAGDKKTPEGVYQVTRYLSGTELDARYGAGAFPLNYPNPVDRIEGRAGSGIWLHGRDDADQEKIVTRGCVAFTNPDIAGLQDILTESTPVVLASQIDYVAADTYIRERARLLGLLDDYLKAWRAGDSAALNGLLHSDFQAGGKDRAAWLERKKWIHQAVPQRVINAQDVQILRESEDQVMYQYVQSYCADNIYTRGTKQLYFKAQNGQLKLVTERFSPLPTLPMDEARLSKFISSWLQSWNDNDVQSYIRHYSPQFTDSKGRDLAGYKAYKTDVFRQRPDQRINIERVQVTPLRGNKYQLEFTQDYASRAYRDKGRKTLIVNGCLDELVIEKETWTAL